MIETIYSKRSNLILGFHGCDRSVADKVIRGEEELLPSTNDYDWLGSGVYCWENNESRAMDFAIEQQKRNSLYSAHITHPSFSAKLEFRYE